MGKYLEFPNSCFVDTLDNIDGLAYDGKQHNMFGFSSENAERIKRQNEQKISVIIGNPPYNANQANFNDFNKNREYPDVDKRIKETYVKHSNAQKTKVYDMYARFYRWATDRLDDNGILAFVTNRSFIDSRTFDGFRKIIASEFNHIYIVDLGGDVRSNPKLSGPKHNVFAIQTGVAIMFLVRKDNRKIIEFETKSTGNEILEGATNIVSEPTTIYLKNGKKVKEDFDPSLCRIQYYRRPEEELATTKLEFLNHAKIQDLAFDAIHPDKNNNWVNLSDDNDWESLIPVADKDVKLGRSKNAIFGLFSLGVVTSRDEWVYDFDEKNLKNKVNYLIDSYNSEIKSFQGKSKDEIKDNISKRDKTNLKWSRAVINDISKGKKYKFTKENIKKSMYRPFVKEQLYFSKELNEMQYQLPKVFHNSNLSLTFCGEGSSKPFQTLIVNEVYNHDLLEKTQSLPLYAYDQEGNRHDNITDWGLSQFQEHYQDTNITKEDIFNYTYAVLHNPAYRKKYELNLKREFPRLPFYDDFFKWVSWGKQLMELHINYETVAPFELQIVDNAHLVKDKNYKLKVKLKADKVNGSIALDEHTYLHGIPESAWLYKLGNRSALEWVLDQYKEKKYTDKTIAEKFNTYRFANYKNHVIDLLKRVCTVSVETMKIIEEMDE